MRLPESLESGLMRSWTLGKRYEITRRPRGLQLPAAVPFAPMEALPQGGQYDARFIDRPVDQLTSGTYFERGDILVAKITPSFENGKQALVRDLTTGCGYATTEVIPIHPTESGRDPRFVFFYLLHPDVRSFVAEKMEGATGRQRVPDQVLLDLQVPEFSPSEEKDIANVLELLQSAIATESLLETLSRQLKQAAMRELFTRGLRKSAQKESIVGPVPEDWTLTDLGTLCKVGDGRIQTGPFGSQLHSYEYQASGLAVVNPTHLDGNRINHEEVPRVSEETAARLSRHVLQPGDILFARRGEIGRLGLVGKSEAGWLCGTGCFLVRVSHPEIINGFLARFFAREEVVSWLSAHAAGAIMPNLNGVVLSRLPVAVPTRDEQQEIVAILDALDEKIDIHRKKRAVLEDLFKSLLHKLMTGEIRVSDLDLSALEQTMAAPASA